MAIKIVPRVAIVPFWTRWQKLAYPTEYLGTYQADLHQLFSIDRHLYEDYKNGISFAVAKGTLLW